MTEMHVLIAQVSTSNLVVLPALTPCSSPQVAAGMAYLSQIRMLHRMLSTDSCMLATGNQVSRAENEIRNF